MKKIFLVLASAAMVLSSCTKGEADNTATSGMATVRFAADANTMDVRGTRAGGQNYKGVIGINYDGAAWEVAPQADVLGFENELSATSNALSIAGNAVKDGAVQIKSTGVNNANFYSVAVASGDVAVSGTTVTLAAEGDGTSLANDYIYASTAQPVNGNETVAFAFKHVMAKLRIEVYEKAYENEKLTSGVTISGFDQLGIVRNGSLDILSGEITPSTTALPSEIAINTEYFVLPQTAGVDKSFNVEYQGKTYTVPLTSTGLTFNANKCRVIRLKVTGSGITFTATLEDWEDENRDFDLQ
ncbi:MAG: fimbrillin family protein [Rikenellaceae bacterium]|nr:fimbrillin family protein [Rikenellaceae bacterium]